MGFVADAEVINMTKKPRRRQKWIIALAIVALLILVGSFRLRSGIQVTIKNSGNAPIRSVVLHVTGNSYPLGDIASGASARATIKSTGESHLEIELIDDDGESKRLNAGGYFEPGYRGSIDASIKNGVLERNQQEMQSY